MAVARIDFVRLKKKMIASGDLFTRLVKFYPQVESRQTGFTQRTEISRNFLPISEEQFVFLFFFHCPIHYHRVVKSAGFAGRMFSMLVSTAGQSVVFEFE